ncbi:hypothetical protein [Candidatus Pelagibacter sp. HIMB1509]|uniref:hypothetical protein n=1 Tax=Candidatus Pelagibacter sp. HIMB1509 TaxID=3413339 RepID=UPI003F86A6FC
MSLRSIFESIWNYDFSHWFIYLIIAFYVIFNLVIILRLVANIFKFKELKKDFSYFIETIGIPLFLFVEIFIAYNIYFD